MLTSVISGPRCKMNAWDIYPSLIISGLICQTGTKSKMSIKKRGGNERRKSPAVLLLCRCWGNRLQNLRLHELTPRIPNPHLLTPLPPTPASPFSSLLCLSPSCSLSLQVWSPTSYHALSFSPLGLILSSAFSLLPLSYSTELPISLILGYQSSLPPHQFPFSLLLRFSFLNCWLLWPVSF